MRPRSVIPRPLGEGTGARATAAGIGSGEEFHVVPLSSEVAHDRPPQVCAFPSPVSPGRRWLMDR